MTVIILHYPDSHHDKWAMWAVFVEQVISYYGAGDVQIQSIATKDIAKPNWLITGPDVVFNSLVELTCTVLSCFHRFFRRQVPFA